MMEKQEIRIRREWKKQLVIGNTTHRSAYDFSLTLEDMEKARDELGETEEVREHALQMVKEMIASDKKISYRTDDSFLLRYLRYKKFDYKKAYDQVRKFYMFRKKHQEIFSLSFDLERVLNTQCFSPLPYRDEKQSILFWVDIKKWKTEEVSLMDVIRTNHAISDIMSMNPACQINGIILVIDFRGVNSGHFAAALYPKTLILLIQMLQDLYPWRVRTIYPIHDSVIIHTTYHTFKYLLKKKIRDRIRMIGSDLKELHQLINPDLLPKEYGGNLEDSECHNTQITSENLPYLEYERGFGPIEES